METESIIVRERDGVKIVVKDFFVYLEADGRSVKIPSSIADDLFDFICEVVERRKVYADVV